MICKRLCFCCCFPLAQLDLKTMNEEKVKADLVGFEKLQLYNRKQTSSKLPQKHNFRETLLE